MNDPRKRNRKIGIGIAAAFAALGGLALSRLWVYPGAVWIHMPFHSTLETLGAIAAMVMAGVLFLNRDEAEGPRKNILGAGFLGMGTLDLLHAACLPGSAFVVLHILSAFAGGLCFVFAWIPKKGVPVKAYEKWLWGILACAVSLTLGYALWLQTMSGMIIRGEFGSAAIMINVISGILYLTASILFFNHFMAHGHKPSLLFFFLCVLFGLAELTFIYSELWRMEWWLWHMVRLAAYALAAGYAVRQIREMSGQFKISEIRRQTVEQLERQNKFLLNILESIPHPFYVIDAQTYQIKMANSVFGKDGIALGKTCHAVTHNQAVPCGNEEHQCPLETVKKTKQPVVVEHIHFDREGRRCLVEVHAYPILDEKGEVVEMAEYSVDVTDKRKAEALMEKSKNDLEKIVRERTEDLERSQTAMLYMVEDLNRQGKELREAQNKIVRTERLAAIGQLAASVAHELRNPLGSMKNVLFYFDLLKVGEGNPDVQEHLKILEQEIQRSNKIISDLLDFSRLREPSVREEDIRSLIESTFKRTVIPPHIRVETRYEQGLPSVEVDPIQMEQVFHNLLMNAVQAMEEKEGVIEIGVRQNGNYLEIKIKDSGPGISPEDLEQIFEPLYSTKARGTGLGLSVCQSIVHGHRGKLEVRSEPGKGAEFTVHLWVKRGVNHDDTVRIAG